jgi:hypothetical protein
MSKKDPVFCEIPNCGGIAIEQVGPFFLCIDCIQND